MAAINFNAETVDPNQVYDALPAGDYPVIISSADIRQTKSGTGQYLEITLDIQSSDLMGRKLFDRLNLWNPNPKTVEIAQRQLSAICHATGVMQLEDTDQLIHRPLIASVKVKDDPGYGLRNEIKGYKAQEGMALAAPVAPPVARVAAPASAPTVRPAAPKAPWAA